MPQERGLYRDMRVIDQLTWLARLHGLDKVTGEARARTLLEQLGLADRADDKILKLTGGLAQRVQLAASMVHRSEERSVGTEWGSKVRSRWSPYQLKKTS